ncbi:MAG TPA: anaerobic ribonucleoside-triphosphate reductase activating protein [Candidatus Absconditabacterales bacterium]|nr:anaerobic ribonucleoside-triphosphate reductase activating protein [Candidatus Absconditabacterales bacterium]
MKISGIQKSTTIDYPGKLACVVFTLGCNFRCPFCHNPETVLPEQMRLIQSDLIPEQAVFNFLKTRVGKLDGVSICGGEPTLQPKLYDFAKKVKEMGFLVKLDTNGRDCEIVKKMVNDGILDYVAIDLKHTRDKYDIAVGLKQNNSFFDNYDCLLDSLLKGDIDYEYRATVVKGMHTLEDIEQMAQYIAGAKNFYLQNYVGGNTLDPSFGGQPFSDEELEEMCKIAKKYVQNCGIRK